MGPVNIPNLTLKGNQNQHLALTQAMQRSLYVLQLPLLELSAFLEHEIDDNPALERLDRGEESPREREENGPLRTKEAKKLREYQESLLTYPISLCEHLMTQAREVLSSREDLALAEAIIGNLNVKGFYTEPINDAHTLHVLHTIQTFDPSGIAAKDVRDSLLIQLGLLGKKNGPAYRLIADHFDDLLKNRRPYLERKLKLSSYALSEVIDEIGRLNFNPASPFQQTLSPPVIPDLILDFTDQKWEIRINDSFLPLFRLSPSSQNEDTFLRRYQTTGKWLFHILHKREKTLRAIADYVIKNNPHFLKGLSRSHKALHMRDLAKQLDLHESTITRAVANKYLFCPAGLFSLRSFFSEERKTAKTLLKELIGKEDKNTPFSDDILAQKLSAQGFPCARRTIAKYRNALVIPKQSLRRAHTSCLRS